MAISNVTGSVYTSDVTTTPAKNTGSGKEAKETQGAQTAAEATGVVYEPSKESTEKTSSNKTNGKVNGDVIAKLKADADARLSQLKSLVEQLISKQGKVNENASIWSQFREGILDGSITVDEATAKQAAEDISEDGYWGVKQTSERILDFAKALTGNDPNKAEAMREAIQKGFKEAAKLWGDELPEISQKTYDAVMKGIDDWKNQENVATAAVTE